MTSSIHGTDVPFRVQPIVFSHDEAEEAPDYPQLTDVERGDAALARRSPFSVGSAGSSWPSGR